MRDKRREEREAVIASSFLPSFPSSPPDNKQSRDSSSRVKKTADDGLRRRSSDPPSYAHILTHTLAHTYTRVNKTAAKLYKSPPEGEKGGEDVVSLSDCVRASAAKALPSICPWTLDSETATGEAREEGRRENKGKKVKNEGKRMAGAAAATAAAVTLADDRRRGNREESEWR